MSRLRRLHHFGQELGAGPIFAFEDSLESAVGIDDGGSHVVSNAAGRIVPER